MFKNTNLAMQYILEFRSLLNLARWILQVVSAQVQFSRECFINLPRPFKTKDTTNHIYNHLQFEDMTSLIHTNMFLSTLYISSCSLASVWEWAPLWRSSSPCSLWFASSP